ncbi:hypothetical protein PIROE2DRAFT_16499 [Piromyces sp. E2]|nr:hypothetical protein PIROE2DRAFT_16499 [Piromyces sp. E2]|eukprot:OUM58268.1 hypothetical protein PIROE2DRAFT_16499 [Piromyces sp. E2]
MAKLTKKQIEIENQLIISTLNSTQIRKLNNVEFIKDKNVKEKCDKNNKTISSLNINPNEMFSIKLINKLYKKINRPLIKENTNYMPCMRASCPVNEKVRNYKNENLVVPVYKNSRYDVGTRIFPNFSNIVDYGQCKMYKNTAYAAIKVLSPDAAGHTGDRRVIYFYVNIFEFIVFFGSTVKFSNC